MVAINRGSIFWEAERNEDGHRDYRIHWLVESDNVLAGPQTISFASGLPAVGSYWQFGTDVDPYAYCWPDWKMSPVQQGEQQLWWIVQQHFSTRPLRRCQDSAPTSPFLEPIKPRGHFNTYTEEALKDRNGKAIVSSSWEPLRGKIVEFDAARPAVSITKNVATLPLSTYTSMIHNVNDGPLWGLAKRCIKLSGITWERLLFGTCSYYYTVTYDFDINVNTFDRVADDEGTRVLAPGGDKNNPTHFILATDGKENPTRILLDGNGNAWQGPLSGLPTPGQIKIEKYKESNLLLLGLPASF